MNIIAVSTLKAFWEQHPDAEQPLKAWGKMAKGSIWNNANEVKVLYKNASIVGNNRVVFNIKGNDYRLVCAINYDSKTIFIKFIGTHQEYDAIDAKTVDFRNP